MVYPNHKYNREVSYYYNMNKIEITFLQEVHSSPDTENRWRHEFGNKIYFSHGSNQARGMAVLINPKVTIEVHNIITDQNGRYIILYTTISKNKFLLSNIMHQTLMIQISLHNG